MVVADPQVIAGGPAQAGAAIAAAINEADATAAGQVAGLGTKRGNTRILDTSFSGSTPRIAALGSTPMAQRMPPTLGGVATVAPATTT
jgi:hypothetical protein